MDVVLASVDVLMDMLAELQQWWAEVNHVYLSSSTAAPTTASSPLLAQARLRAASSSFSSLRHEELHVDTMVSVHGLGLCQHILWWCKQLEVVVCARAGALWAKDGALDENNSAIAARRTERETAMTTGAMSARSSTSLPHACTLAMLWQRSRHEPQHGTTVQEEEKEDEDVLRELVVSASRLFVDVLYRGVMQPSAQVMAARGVYLLLWDEGGVDGEVQEGLKTRSNSLVDYRAEMAGWLRCVRNIASWCRTHLRARLGRASFAHEGEVHAVRPVVCGSKEGLGDGVMRWVLHHALVSVLEVAMERAEALLAVPASSSGWDESIATRSGSAVRAVDGEVEMDVVPPMRVRLARLLDGIVSVPPCETVLAEDSAYVTLRRFCA